MAAPNDVMTVEEYAELKRRGFPPGGMINGHSRTKLVAAATRRGWGMFTDADGKLCKQVDPDDRRLRVLPFHQWEDLWTNVLRPRSHVDFHESLTPYQALKAELAASREHVTELQDRIAALQPHGAQVLELEAQAEAFRERIAALEPLEAQVLALQERIAALEPLEAQVAALQERNAALQERNAAIQEQIAALQPHEAQVLELEAQAEAFRERIAALEPVEAQVAALQERNAALQEQNAALEEKLRLAKVAHDEEVQRLNEDMARLGGLDGGVGEGESESKSESGAGNVVGGAAAGAGAQEVAGPSETEPTQTVAAANGRDGGRADQDTAGTQDVVKSSPKADA